MIHIAKILASLGDAHTSLYWPFSARLPFQCYWFEDGLYITATTADYAKMRHAKLQSIDGLPIDRVIQKLADIIPHENTAFLKSQLPKTLVSAEILYSLEITGSMEHIRVGIQHAGKAYEMPVNILPELSPNDLIQESGALPLYRQHPGEYYWKTRICNDTIIYANYSKCKDMLALPVRDFCKALKKDMAAQKTQALMLDLRNNGGGDSTLLEPFIQWLGKNPTPVKVYAVIGRDTFSSALLNVYSLKNQANAIIIGEPTGGKPNSYGEVQYFRLKNSGLIIRYSTVYYQLIEDDKTESLFPDIELKPTIGDFIEKRDPCAAYVCNLSE
jgi:hypothetical protein